MRLQYPVYTDSSMTLKRAHSSIVPDPVTTCNLGEEEVACDREEAEEGHHAEVHREVEVPAVGLSLEDPHVDGHLVGEALERLVREVAAWHDLPNATADPGDHRNFLVVAVRRNFHLPGVVVHRSFHLPGVGVHRNFHLPGVGGQLEPVNAMLVEVARKNKSTAAYPAVQILVDLACLASAAEVVRS
jgi:hypothetical protein